jgi:hypothetical protein
VPAILYFLPEGTLQPEPKEDDDIHSFLMMAFGIKEGLVKIFKYENRYIPVRPSWSFESMPHKLANQYMDFLEKWVIENIGHSMAELVKQYKENV